jgi:hypothetical protein
MDGEGAMKRWRSTTLSIAALSLLAALLVGKHERSRSHRPVEPLHSALPTRRAIELVRVDAKAPSSEPAERGKPQAEPAHSHPITAQHLRMRRERALVTELDQSMHLRDLATFDATLAIYRSEFPEDPRHLQQGYTIMGACLREPNSSNRRAAEEFYRAHRSSTLRRWLRRLCFAERDL